jgi:hypothetical protein
VDPELIAGQGAGTSAVASAPPDQTQTPPAAPAPAHDPSAAASQLTGTTSPGAGEGTQTGASPLPGAANPQAAAQAQTVRDVLATMGLQAGQFGSDQAALQYLVAQAQQAQQLQQLVPYAQQYMQHAGQFQQWMAQQQLHVQQQQQAQQQKWWEAPEYDPSWAQKIVRDQAGNLTVLPGNDPSIIQKYMKWAEHQTQFLNKFSQDPLGAIKPGIEQLIEQKAQQLFQQQYAQIQEQQTATTFLNQNSGWLHERDATGNLVPDPRTGQPMLSGMGRVFAQFVQEAEGLGLRDSYSQQRYAMAQLKAAYLESKFQQQPQAAGAQPGQPNPADALKQQFLQTAAGGAAQAGQPVGQAAAHQIPAQTMSSRGLAELMAREFAAAGIQPGSQLER